MESGIIGAVKICPACSREYPSERTHCESDGVGLVALQTGAEVRPEELIGQIVDGRYRVERIIGRGGMGVVYAVRHVVVGKPAAMKVLRLGVEKSEGVLQRFIREAQTASAVRSRHITEMTDFGQLPNGFFFVVMELLEGMTLTAAMRDGRLGREHYLHIFTQMAQALALVHEQGIVHRDLKPDNVFLVNEGGDPLFVKLLDFGIAKVMTAEASGLTETGVILGTPYYMSPEQARGERLDHRADIYAMGVIMYRAFTGKLPFVAESMLGVLTRHLTEAPAPPSHITSIDGRTEHVILRCMEKSPDARFQSMHEVAAALAAIAAYPEGAPAEGSPGASHTAAFVPAATTRMDAAAHAAWARQGRPSYQGVAPPSGAYPAVVGADSRSGAAVSAPTPTAMSMSPYAPSASVPPTTGTYGAMGQGAPSGAYPPAGTSVTSVTSAPSGAYPSATPSGILGPGAAGGSSSGLYPSPVGGPFHSSSGLHPSPAAGPFHSSSGLHPSPAAGPFNSPSGRYSSPAVPAPSPSYPGSNPPGQVPELATQRGLATSDTGSVKVEPRRGAAVAVGVPIGIALVAAVAAIGFFVGRGGRGEGDVTGAPSGVQAAPGEAKTTAVAAPDKSAAAPGEAASAAPSSAAASSAPADPSASADPSAAAAASGAPSQQRPAGYGYGKPTPPAVKTAQTSAPREKRPEIRSPFE